MKIRETDFEGLFLLEPRVFRDDRDFLSITCVR